MRALRRVAGSNSLAAVAKLLEPAAIDCAACCPSSSVMESLQHQARGGLGGTDHAGHAGAGMGAGAHQIEVVDPGVAVVGPEPGALGENRLQREGGTQVRVELIAKIDGAEVPAGHQVLPQLRDVAALQIVEDAVAV